MSTYINEAEGLEFLKTVRVVLASEYKRLTPRCPECGARMKECIADASGKPFWGCPRFPHCKGFRGMRRSPAGGTGSRARRPR